MSSGISSLFGRKKESSDDKQQPVTVTHYTNPLLDQPAASAALADRVVNDDMIYYCFDVLHSHLHRSPIDSIKKPEFPNSEYPLFVTW